MKTMNWIGRRMEIGLLSAALLSGGVGYAAVNSGTPGDTPVPAVNQLLLAVPTVTCGSCEGNIHRALEAQPGVREVEVDLGSRTVRVIYDGLRADPKALADTVTRAGYPARYLPAGARPPAAQPGSGGCGGNCCGSQG